MQGFLFNTPSVYFVHGDVGGAPSSCWKKHRERSKSLEIQTSWNKRDNMFKMVNESWTWCHIYIHIHTYIHIYNIICNLIYGHMCFSTMWNLLKSSMRWQQRNSGDPASETPKKSRRFSMTSGDTMGFSKHVSTTKCWWYLDTCSWICWIYYTSTDLYIYVYIYNCVKIITSNYTSWYFDVLVLQCSLG